MSGSLSIVIPCFDEAHRLEGTFAGVDVARSVVGLECEVLLVDDGSADQTAAIAERCASDRTDVRVLRRPHLGKGAAVRHGVAQARGDWVFMADADWSMPPEQLTRFLPAQLGDFDLAFGSREHAASARHGEPWRRHALGRGFNTLVRWSLLPGVLDSQCGFKCFRRATVGPLFSRCVLDGWAFDVELLVAATDAGLSLVEVPIDWHYKADSRLRPGRDAVAMGLDLVRVHRSRRKGDGTR